MSTNFIPFSKPSINQAAIDEVVDCLQSGWLTSGPKLAQFTKALQNYFDREYVIPLTSATAGLHLSLHALDIKAGDEVITTPLTFVATLNTIIHAGAKPVLVDVDHTLNIDVNKIEAAITPKTRAIMPVHFAGLPVDLEPLYQIANQHNIRVIEDCAHAIGAHYNNQLIGSFGDIQVFSFHPNKNMTTGEGGCVVTSDKELAKRVSLLLFHGIERSATNQQEYNVVEAGYKANMMDIQAALGLHQLPQLNTFIQKRTELANRYRDFLADWDEFTLPTVPDYKYSHAWHLFTVLVNNEKTGIDRKTFMEKMKSLNIGTGLHYQANHLHQYYREKYNFKPGDFPVAEAIAEKIVSLPLYPDMSFSDQDCVFRALESIYRD